MQRHGGFERVLVELAIGEPYRFRLMAIFDLVAFQ